MTDGSKKGIAESILDRSLLTVHLDPRREGVVAPQHLTANPSLILDVGRSGLRVPIPDLVVDDFGIRGTLSFNNQPFACVLPWTAIYALFGDRQQGRSFPEDVPADLPPAHHDACSFCLRPRMAVAHLVAADEASICDVCIDRHLPRSLCRRLFRRFFLRKPPALGGIVAMPYRTAAEPVCDFCHLVSPLEVLGVHAQICRPCLTLASDVLPRR